MIRAMFSSLPDDMFGQTETHPEFAVAARACNVDAVRRLQRVPGRRRDV